eukprot:TRINITY_DN19216_c0_g2_i1.p1 TRINITY_DN19216_c0_g2~~TRINITY_DN19216_c0_g2_i1.p1  ORF type:complete len:823 (-),score=142.60 TRINITY_DN19216_c0_g2_i1:1377-3671(-)
MSGIGSDSNRAHSILHGGDNALLEAPGNSALQGAERFGSGRFSEIFCGENDGGSVEEAGPRLLAHETTTERDKNTGGRGETGRTQGGESREGRDSTGREVGGGGGGGGGGGVRGGEKRGGQQGRGAWDRDAGEPSPPFERSFAITGNMRGFISATGVVKQHTGAEAMGTDCGRGEGGGTEQGGEAMGAVMDGRKRKGVAAPLRDYDDSGDDFFEIKRSRSLPGVRAPPYSPSRGLAAHSSLPGIDSSQPLCASSSYQEPGTRSSLGGPVLHFQRGQSPLRQVALGHSPLSPNGLSSPSAGGQSLPGVKEVKRGRGEMRPPFILETRNRCERRKRRGEDDEEEIGIEDGRRGEVLKEEGNTEGKEGSKNSTADGLLVQGFGERSIVSPSSDVAANEALSGIRRHQKRRVLESFPPTQQSCGGLSETFPGRFPGSSSAEVCDEQEGQLTRNSARFGLENEVDIECVSGRESFLSATDGNPTLLGSRLLEATVETPTAVQLDTAQMLESDSMIDEKTALKSTINSAVSEGLVLASAGVLRFTNPVLPAGRIHAKLCSTEGNLKRSESDGDLHACSRSLRKSTGQNTTGKCWKAVRKGNANLSDRGAESDDEVQCMLRKCRRSTAEEDDDDDDDNDDEGEGSNKGRGKTGGGAMSMNEDGTDVLAAFLARRRKKLGVLGTRGVKGDGEGEGEAAMDGSEGWDLDGGSLADGEFDPTFVLSSGRGGKSDAGVTQAMGRADEGFGRGQPAYRRQLTIDDEFEQYFSNMLM